MNIMGRKIKRVRSFQLFGFFNLFRIKTPMCNALKKLNNIDGKLTE